MPFPLEMRRFPPAIFHQIHQKLIHMKIMKIEKPVGNKSAFRQTKIIESNENALSQTALNFYNKNWLCLRNWRFCVSLVVFTESEHYNKFYRSQNKSFSSFAKLCCQWVTRAYKKKQQSLREYQLYYFRKNKDLFSKIS